MASPPDDPRQSFGCATCFGDDAGALWSARPWAQVTSLIEDSHFGVSISECPSCGQRFVDLFTEFIAWHGGDDAQHWDLLPVSEEEARELAAQGEQVSLKRIEALSEGRRRLQVDYPTARFATGRLLIRPGY